MMLMVWSLKAAGHCKVTAESGRREVKHKSPKPCNKLYLIRQTNNVQVRLVVPRSVCQGLKIEQAEKTV